MTSDTNLNSVKRIDLEHLRQFQRQLPTILIGQQITALVLAFLVSNHLDGLFITIWTIVMTMILVFRVAYFFHEERYPNSLENLEQRISLHIWCAGATAGMWGLLGFISLNPNETVLSLTIVMVLMGLVASSVASTANLRKVFVIYSLLTMVPAAIKLMMFNQTESTFLAFLLLFFLFIVSQFEKGVHHTLTESIRLRFNNLKLIENLTQEKIRAEEAQRNAEEALGAAESANIAKSQFLAAASHDLRQPLHALRLLSSTLENTNLDVQQKPVVSNINSSVLSLQELLNALLDISKLDAGTQSVQHSTLELTDVFDNLRRTHLAVANERGINFTVTKTDAIIHTDVLLFERLLSNLVSNAIRYTQRGSVEVLVEYAEDQCTVSVRDTGIGIGPEDQQRIFDEFVQLENPERDRTKGIGLGLAIVKRTAKLLDLPLKMESTKGKGSIFSVTVPTGNAEDITDVEQPLDTNFNNLNGMLVLVVDDEISVRTALEGLLESWGCVVLLASDGNEAIDIVNEVETPPEAVIADLRLRDNETGVDVIRRVHTEFKSSSPALIMTGDTAPSRLRELQSTSYPILHKPCDPQALKLFLSSVKQVKMALK